ncbi:MAG: HIT domain-containing protein [Planctomycetes bacterium]|nr:HIT domain-containing protein [Planctomycetota bacterium]
MEVLWAPWRMEFITGKRAEGCVFCKAPAERDRLKENLVLHVGKLAFVIMNRYPYHSGHLMVIPVRHTSDFTDLTAAEHAEMCELLSRSMLVLRGALRPEGFNLGINLGHCAGAGIREHLHWHIVPRWIGDTNFFPLLAGTRSIPEMLHETYDRLRPVFAEHDGSGTVSSPLGPPKGTVVSSPLEECAPSRPGREHPPEGTA